MTTASAPFTTDAPTLRVGRIAYTNVVPVYTGVETGAVALPGTLVAGTPAALNAQTAAGTLDISPVSAAHYLRNAAEYELLPDICIGARNHVMSVILVSSQSLAELDGARVAITKESASSVALIEMLLRKSGATARFEPVDDAIAAAQSGTPTLLIGERALDALALFPQENILDLGAAWRAWTGLEMVFAVWVARKSVARARPDDVAAVNAALVASHLWSLRHPLETIAAAQRAADRPAELYARYFRTLNYTFDDSAKRGLARFAYEIASLDTRATAPTAVRIPA